VTALADVRWRHGSPSGDAEPPLEIHAVDEATWVLRQSKTLHFEAPFLYVLLGRTRALLVDTGAVPPPGRAFPLREAVEGLIGARELVVVHTHDHDDHVGGDAQFAGRPGTTVVPAEGSRVRDFFGLPRWPDGEAILDLGDRPLTVFPIPGHEPAHIALHDPRTGILLSGDTLYPGILTVRDVPAFCGSARRLQAFGERTPITHVLGGHVEMTRTPRQAYPLGCTYQPDEHPLPLAARHLAELAEACASLGAPEVIRDSFIVRPIANGRPLSG
jgi:glyoxylase-like metal-dependent hydrolase (beta-lactamase superfamily II)